MIKLKAQFIRAATIDFSSGRQGETFQDVTASGAANRGGRPAKNKTARWQQ
jgi:hypothetical protein